MKISIALSLIRANFAAVTTPQAASLNQQVRAGSATGNPTKGATAGRAAR
jgi:hypothetical protein